MHTLLCTFAPVKKNFLLFILVGVPMLMLAAQDVPTDTARIYTLDEAVVTGSPKDHVALSQQAQSSSSFDGDDLVRKGIAAPKDISAIAPNLYMPDYGSRLTSAVYVRGVGSRSGSPAVGLYVDNIPLSDKSMYDFELGDIERIDVLRGPAGTLYGRGSMGGLLRIFTADPTYHTGTHLRLAASTRENGLGGMFQTYLHPAQTLALSVGGFLRGDKGFRRNATSGHGADGSRLGGGRMRAVFRPNEAWRFDLTASYQYSDEDSNPYVLLSATDDAYFPERAGMTREDLTGKISQNRQSSYRRSLLNSGLSAEWRGSSLSFTSITSGQFFRDRLFMDQDYIAADIFSLEQKQRYGSLSEELTLRNHTDGRWQWTFGTFFQADRKRTTCPVDFYEDGVDFFNQTFRRVMPPFIALTFTDERLPFFARLTSPSTNAALFHQSTLKNLFASGLSLTAGLRLDYDRHSLRLASPATDYNYNFHLDMPDYGLLIDAPFSADAAFSGRSHMDTWKLLPKVALSYNLPDELGMVYGSVSRGYRAGGYNMENYSDLSQNLLRRNIMLQVADFSEQTIMGLPISETSKQAAVGGMSAMIHANMPQPVNVEQLAYEPETSWSHEIGAHLDLLSHKLQADAALFMTRTHDLQVSRFSPSGMGREVVNAGESRTFGAELSLRHQQAWGGSTPATTLDLLLCYGFAHSTFTRYDAGTVGGVANDYKGNYVPFAPRHTLALSADLRHELSQTGFLRAFFGDLSLTGEGSIYWDEANTMKRPFAARLSARLGAELGGIATLTLWGRNLTANRYESFSFLSMSRRYAQWGDPLHFALELDLRL